MHILVNRAAVHNLVATPVDANILTSMERDRPELPAVQRKGISEEQLLQRTMTGLFIAAMVSVLFYYGLYRVYTSASPEEGYYMSAHLFRAAYPVLQDYYDVKGHFPPAISDRSFYGLLTDNLTTPIQLVENRRIYKGPPVDPFRQKPLFSGEQSFIARYSGRKSKIFYKKNSGYAPRYYRSEDGQWAIMLSNGPDRDCDIGSAQLDKITSAPYLALQSYTYDATNGSRSGGDIYFVVAPPAEAPDQQ